ncbi:hypothetical protein BJ912DRAFT_1019144 [Pholiota molesta]|nr:hypothetical protein BJ912DRAFT_1019144 [Pholiota molesta]
MAPVPQEELPILEALINIRNRLTALKKDRGEFIKAADVNQLYQAVVKQITKLNDVRDDTTPITTGLLSLFYLTIGKTRDAPAAYCQIASMRQILNHMNESAVYNEADLAPFHKRLSELRQIHPKALTKLLERQLNECDAIVKQLQESLSVLSPELVPVHQKLVTIRRQLVALGAREGSKRPSSSPCKKNSAESIPICSSLLEECFDIVQEIKANEDSKNVASSLNLYTTGSVRSDSTREPGHDPPMESARDDLWNYSLSLQEIDKMRVDGKFVDSEGIGRRPICVSSSILKQVLLYLLRRCYGLIYRLLSSSEPVSEELMPVANKLTTVKKCLNEYQLALFQIDSMRKDGRFIGVDGSIPEGQGIINANLSECHELVEMLKESMDEGETEEDDEDDYVYSDSDSEDIDGPQ